MFGKLDLPISSSSCISSSSVMVDIGKLGLFILCDLRIGRLLSKPYGLSGGSTNLEDRGVSSGCSNIGITSIAVFCRCRRGDPLLVGDLLRGRDPPVFILGDCGGDLVRVGDCGGDLARVGDCGGDLVRVGVFLVGDLLLVGDLDLTGDSFLEIPWSGPLYPCLVEGGAVECRPRSIPLRPLLRAVVLK